VERVLIEGERLTLRPLVVDELDASIATREAADRTAHPVKPDREKLKARFEHSGSMRDGAIDLAIDVDGIRMGEIQTYVPPGRALPPGAYEVGIMIDEPLRGRGYGREAVELFVDWLFAAQAATRVHMPTVETNTAMRTVLEHLGFHREGTVHDMGIEFVFYVVTRDAWRARHRTR
jgi:RimJ/RimL family protein N-acetyltransferase